MKRQFFGTDGVRGLYGGPVINEDFAARLGFAVGRWSGGAVVAVIGHDTRHSGGSLALAVARGLAAAGLQTVSLGMVPTPLVSRAVRTHGAALGVMITASHNAATDNGFKFFGRAGIKLTDADESAIERQLPATAPAAAEPSFPVIDELGGYIAATSRLLPPASLRSWRIALDTANGATCITSPVVLRALGAEIIDLGNVPDGRNINDGVGSEHP